MPRRFRFHGHAIGAGGRINHPFHEFIDIQAASALPEIGGHGSAQSSNFRYRDILGFAHAQTEVTGTHGQDPKGKPLHKTLVRATIEDLDIMGMVTADRIELRLVSYCGDDPDDEPCFKFTGSYFHNLRIAGVPVKVHLAVDAFDRLHQHSNIVKSYKERGEFRDLFESITLKDRIKETPERVRRWFQQAPENGSDLPHFDGVTTMSLVRKLDFEREEFPCHGHIIHIDGFGTIHLAEVSVSKRERHITMLRVDLGSPVDGILDVGTGCGNGAPY
ncbi:MAG TPA: hypothetical protein VKT49_21860 [Bryobacteraceae bacterium]|nr:hypothetical protein [Bryobacteraceae bacterium]